MGSLGNGKDSEPDLAVVIFGALFLAGAWLFFWGPMLAVVVCAPLLVLVVAPMAYYLFETYRCFVRVIANVCLWSWGKLTGKPCELYAVESMPWSSRLLQVVVLSLSLTFVVPALIPALQSSEEEAAPKSKGTNPAEIESIRVPCCDQVAVFNDLNRRPTPGGRFRCKDCVRYWLLNPDTTLTEVDVDWEPVSGKKNSLAGSVIDEENEPKKR